MLDVRFKTQNGPVLVWQPAGYDPKTAGTCVYIHGYYTNVDEALVNHHLIRKFTASRQNATFIMIEAPSKPGDPVRWSSLGDLLEAVEHELSIKLGDPVGVMSHSAGYKTASLWIGNPRLIHITLLDSLYGFVDTYRLWLASPGKTANLLVTMGGLPKSNTEEILPKLSGVVKRPGVPVLYNDFSPEEKAAKILYMTTTIPHMDLVEKDAVIPVLLRRSPWKLLA